MTSLPPDADAALAPLRERLLDDARATASGILAEEREKAGALVAEAEEEAESIRAAAAAAGEETARSEVALRSARVRRQAHETVLAAQSDLRLEVRRRVREKAVALVEDQRYPALLERLRAQARAALGTGVVITESPEGGLVAEAGSRRLDLTLPTLANAAFEAAGDEITRLWAEP
ncbi:MAG: hypothetical protein ACQERF_06900 [Actinomycetota bacterium]